MRYQRHMHMTAILLVLFVVGWSVSARIRQLHLNRQLVLAVDRGDLAEVKSLIRQGANIHSKKDGRMPLLCSAEAAARVRPGDSMAPDPQKVAIATFLLDTILQDKISPEEDSCVLDVGVDTNRLDIIKRLLKSDPDPQVFLPVLDQAARQGKTEVVARLIESGVQPVGQAGGEYALHAAVRSPEGGPTVRMLLERGVNVDSAEQNGETTLMGAASSGQLEIVRILLQHGAKVNARNVKGVTPLMYAAGYDHPDIVKDLIAQGADVNANGTLYRYKKAKNFRMDFMSIIRGTPLHIARQFGYSNVARLLQQAGGRE